jgi:hypothetical protein
VLVSACFYVKVKRKLCALQSEFLDSMESMIIVSDGSGGKSPPYAFSKISDMEERRKSLQISSSFQISFQFTKNTHEWYIICTKNGLYFVYTVHRRTRYLMIGVS